MDFTKQHVETTFGKIDPLTRGGDWEVERKKFLYWLQHIIVNFQIDVPHETNPDVKKSEGGYYQKFGHSNLSDVSDNSYVKQHVDPQTDLFVIINLYATSEELLNAAKELVTHTYHIEMYGEPYDDLNSFNDFLQRILPVFAHEVTHLEQSIRDYLPGKWHKMNDLNYLPSGPRPIGQRKAQDPKKGYEHFRAGKRGNIERQPDTIEQYTTYLGNSSEIEAWAVAVASDIIKHLDFTSRRFNSQDLTYTVTQAIEDLKSGYVDNSWHFDKYQQLIRERIPKTDGWEKVNQTFRKVWTLFIKKIIQHLETYKAEVVHNSKEDSEYNDGGPYKSRVGNIIHPGKKPNIP